MPRPLASRSLFALALALSATMGARALRAEDPPPAPAPSDPDETRGYVGYTPALIQLLPAEEREVLEKAGLTRKVGLCVARVLTDGPADLAGLKVGDVVVKVRGKDVADAEKVPAGDEEAAKAWMSGPFKAIGATVKPGDEVEMVVERAGKPITIKPVAITFEAMKKLQWAQQEDEEAIPIPSADDQGTPRAVTYDFEKIPDDQARPAEILSSCGLWEAKEDPSSEKPNHVLNQSSDNGDRYAVALATAKGLAYGDATVSVRLRLVEGERAVAGGVVLRARDRKNWYGVVVNGVAKQLQIVRLTKLAPSVLAAVDIGQPSKKAWHALEVKIVGDRIEASLDGGKKVEAKDAALPKPGWFGLLTLGDAECDFDDWKITPASP